MKKMCQIAKRIRKIREDKGMTYTTFARAIDDDTPRLQAVELKRQRVPVDMLANIVKAFHINPYWLFYGQLPIYSDKDDKEATTKSIEGLKKASIIEFVTHFLNHSDRDDVAWFEGQLSRCIPEYNEFKRKRKEDGH